MSKKKNDIGNRDDVEKLVRSFYIAVRKDDLIGPVFNSVIQSDEEWEAHFEKLTDFWETNLFFLAKYKGNPMKVHKEVDEHTGNQLSQKHFDRWLEIWKRTVDHLYEGPKADYAKRNAGNIAAFMLRKIKTGKQF